MIFFHTESKSNKEIFCFGGGGLVGRHGGRGVGGGRWMDR